MSPNVLDATLWILGIRGHSQHDDFHAASSGSSPGAASGGGALARILIAVVASLACLALVLWATVWLAIRLL